MEPTQRTEICNDFIWFRSLARPVSFVRSSAPRKRRHNLSLQWLKFHFSFQFLWAPSPSWSWTLLYFNFAIAKREAATFRLILTNLLPNTFCRAFRETNPFRIRSSESFRECKHLPRPTQRTKFAGKERELVVARSSPSSFLVPQPSGFAISDCSASGEYFLQPAYAASCLKNGLAKFATKI